MQLRIRRGAGIAIGYFDSWGAVGQDHSWGLTKFSIPAVQRCGLVLPPLDWSPEIVGLHPFQFLFLSVTGSRGLKCCHSPGVIPMLKLVFVIFPCTQDIDTHKIQWSKRHIHTDGLSDLCMDLVGGNASSWCFPLASQSPLLVLSQVGTDFCCSFVLSGCWSLSALLREIALSWQVHYFLFSPQRMLGVRYSFNAGEHQLSLKAEWTKDTLTFLWTFKVMLSVASISRKCSCSGLSTYALMAAHVLLKFLSMSVLSIVAPIFFSAVQVLKAGLSLRYLSDGFKGK